jgi:hypothetical protein
MTKFNIQTNTGLSDRAIVAIGDRFDVVLIRTADGLKIEVYPITDGDAWDDPFERFEIDESEIRKLEEEKAKTEATATCPLLVPSGTPLIEGKLYLHLYHGRKDPAEEMQNWGFDGPTFGPLCNVGMTYFESIRYCRSKMDDDFGLTVRNDLIAWDGSWYGQFTVFIAGKHDRG